MQGPTLSADGNWVALAAVPDRGDGEVLVYPVRGGEPFSISRGGAPRISRDGTWVAVRLEPSFEARETAGREDSPRPALALLNTDSGEVTEWEEIQRFAFSDDGRWLARLAHAPRAQDGHQPCPGVEAAR